MASALPRRSTRSAVRPISPSSWTPRSAREEPPSRHSSTASKPRDRSYDDRCGLERPEDRLVAEVFYAFRDAADVGPLSFKLGALNEILSPTADPVWVKGDETTGNLNADDLVSVAVTRPDPKKPLASVASHLGSPDTISLRQEWYAVGTSRKSIRIVTFTREVID